MKEEMNNKRVELNEEALEEVNAGLQIGGVAEAGFFRKIWRFFKGIGEDANSSDGVMRLNDKEKDNTIMLAEDKVMMLAEDDLNGIG